MNLGFYLLIFQYTREIGRGSGWGKYEFFVFLATTMFINSLVQAFFMPNAQEFSELIRTGNLDFALLKPIDTQFLISLQRVEWSALANFGVRRRSCWPTALIQLTTRPAHPLVLHPLACRALSVLRPLRHGDPVQPDDLAGGHQHLAGTEPDAVQLLVLHHQFFPLSDGDLQRALWHAAAGRSLRS